MNANTNELIWTNESELAALGKVPMNSNPNELLSFLSQWGKIQPSGHNSVSCCWSRTAWSLNQLIGTGGRTAYQNKQPNEFEHKYTRTVLFRWQLRDPAAEFHPHTQPRRSFHSTYTLDHVSALFFNNVQNYNGALYPVPSSCNCIHDIVDIVPATQWCWYVNGFLDAENLRPSRSHNFISFRRCLWLPV